LGYTAGLVVSADEVDAVGVAEFEADEEGDCFYAEETTIDVVAYFLVLVDNEDRVYAMYRCGDFERSQSYSPRNK
jgi:hypothetical protein